MKTRFHEEFIKYNANERDANVGDCVKRAISFALDIPYNTVRKEMNDMFGAGNSTKTVNSISTYIKHKTGVSKITLENGKQPTIEEFANEYPNGTYLVLCGPKGKVNHLACVLDGDLYDSWNSMQQYVMYYYPITKEQSTRSKTDIKEYLSDLKYFAQNEFKKRFMPIVSKNSLDNNIFSYSSEDSYIKDYAINIVVEIDFKYKKDGETRRDTSTIAFAIALSPMMSIEDGKAKIIDTINTKGQREATKTIKNIKEKIENANKGYLLDPTKLSAKAKQVWNALDDDVRRTIKHLSYHSWYGYDDYFVVFANGDEGSGGSKQYIIDYINNYYNAHN